MSLLRNPFVIPLVIAFIASVVGLIVAIAITYSDLNDAALPDSIWGAPHSYEFKNFVRRRTSGVVPFLDKTLRESLSNYDNVLGIEFDEDDGESTPVYDTGTIGAY